MKEGKARGKAEFRIGDRVYGVMLLKGVTKSELGRRIGKARQNISDILERDSLDTHLLWEISVALGHDFFQYFSAGMHFQSEGGEREALMTELAGLDTEMRALMASLEKWRPG